MFVAFDGHTYKIIFLLTLIDESRTNDAVQTTDLHVYDVLCNVRNLNYLCFYLRSCECQYFPFCVPVEITFK